MTANRNALVTLCRNRDGCREGFDALETISFTDDALVVEHTPDREPSIADAVVERGNRFQPLSPAQDHQEPAVTATTPVQLSVPKVVQSVLAEYGDQWFHVARGVHHRSLTAGLRTVLVASCQRAEGCTTVAVSLAVTLSEYSHCRVLLCDVDFASPAIAGTLKLSPKTGFDGVLLDRLSLDQAVVFCDSPRIDVLPVVKRFEYPDLLFESDRLAKAIKRLRSFYDVIVFDVGCSFSSQRPPSILPGADSVLLVRNPHRTTQEALYQLDDHFASHQVDCLGVIENGVTVNGL